jgi:mutator protein MutT
MRIRAGRILIEDDKLALIERHRAGLHYFTFPGGGVDEGESPQQAAVREAEEELGITVSIKQKVAEVQFGQKNRQIYFLVERTGGEFGTGTGEEFAESNHHNPQRGIYIPVWRSIDELPQLINVYPADVARLVVKSKTEGWSEQPILIFEQPK